MSPKTILRSLALLIATFIGLLMFWFIRKPAVLTTDYPSVPTLTDADNPYASLFIPAFKLTDSDGLTVDESILNGRYTVVDFFYTSCPLICPGMTAAMKNIQDQTQDTNLQLLSISIDPEIDTPEVIKNYSAAYGADAERWKFLTGAPEIIDLILAGVQFELTGLKTDQGFRDIGHPSTILLIGPDRHAINLYRYSDPDQIDELIKTAKLLAQ